MTPILHEGNSYDVLRGMIERGEFVHSVVTDPPYGLVSVVKRFGKEGSAAAKHGKDGAFARQSRGFMGKLWDGTAIERDPEFWKLVYQVMLPGAYIVAFSSSRTYHHMAVAMEQAGFITHPMIGWTFASGFPKAHNAARAIDATLISGKMRTEDMRKLAMGDDYEPSGRGRVNYDNGGGSKMNGATGPYDPQTPEAAQWEGWHYGGQARKPALEPIYVGQKPFSEKNGALNILKHGVGAVNIDGCRADNRWPANLIHDGSGEVVALFPDSKGAAAPVTGKETSSKTENVYGSYAGRAPSDQRDEGGSAARFFESYPFEDRPIFHYPKANKRDRAGSKHPTVKPIALMRALIRHVTPAGGRVLDPFAGSGTTGQAAVEEGMQPVLIEMEAEYAADIRRRLNLALPAQDSSFDDLLGTPEGVYSTISRMNDFEDVLG